MTNEMSARQLALNLELPSSVAVVGCGGVGHWVALLLALTGVPELLLFDGDVISESNLNRIMHRHSDIGQRKTEALRELIQFYRPDCNVMCFGRFVPEVADSCGIGDRAKWIVAATDTHDSRVMLHKYCNEHYRCSYIEVAAEGEIGSISASPADFCTPEETQPGYASVPVWVGPAISAALMAVSYICHADAALPEAARAGFDGEHFSFYMAK